MTTVSKNYLEVKQDKVKTNQLMFAFKEQLPQS